MAVISTFTLPDYQKERPFASFLSGIAGKKGIPLWAFFVNRGQALASFGLRDKNGAIEEYFPANSMYRFVSQIGFRTFLKANGSVHEFFLEKNSGQKMSISSSELSIEETCQEFGIKITVTYFTIPNERIAGLARKVEVTNLNKKPLDIEIIDGLAQLLPSGVEYGAFKSIGNLQQSWMESRDAHGYVFYTLRGSTSDSAEVHEVVDGNFYLTASDENPLYISDTKLVFDEDVSLMTPHAFISKSIAEMRKIRQAHVNQLPCGFTGFAHRLDERFAFCTLIGHVSNPHELEALLPKFTLGYFSAKEEENRQLHEELLEPIETRTSYPLLDAYFKQSYLDNLIRGGTPIIVDTADGKVGYYLFSRRHGDLERDYNFFSVEPSYYSQGNGAFRDVLQNRRNDIYFTPEIGDFNIRQFGSLIQADGYNPLSIEGLTFSFIGDAKKYPASLSGLLQGEFTPGQVATMLDQAGYDIEKNLAAILADSHFNFKASFGEGYWEDHFTYLYDLVDSFLSIFPDKEDQLLFEKKYSYFVSPVEVLPRSEKYVMRPDGSIRQYGALRHKSEAPASAWLVNKNERLYANLYGKLLTLVLNKAAHLDPEGMGLSYEADKPGWNDAMNGLPGLFGSGVSEAIELKRIAHFLVEATKRLAGKKARLLASTDLLAHKLEDVPENDGYAAWDYRMNCLESYREELKKPQTIVERDVATYLSLLEKIDAVLARGIKKAQALSPIIPTYLIYEATGHEPINGDDGKPKKNINGLPLVHITGFKVMPVPNFLEAPSRYLSSLCGKAEAQAIYKEVAASPLHDKKLGIYQTCVPIESFTPEVGRVHAFTPGWLEREADFLHMTYKYLLGLLKAGLYAEFFAEMKTNFTCFMDPKVYGRSPLENSSFIATSSNPDPKKHGQGFYARLSGSTAEVISMWRYMFIGDKPFAYENGQLVFSLKPILPKSFFIDKTIETKLFGKTRIVYHNEDNVDTFDPSARIERLEIHADGKTHKIAGNRVIGQLASLIREGNFPAIDVYIKGGI